MNATTTTHEDGESQAYEKLKIQNDKWDDYVGRLRLSSESRSNIEKVKSMDKD